LFFTALKCRDRRIRLQAVRLLNTIPFSQGGWSCLLMSKIAAEIVTLEQDASTDHFLKDGFDVTDTQTFAGVETSPQSSSKLIHDVRISSWDTSTDTVSLRCQQWTDDGGVITFYHDMIISQ
jgi:hypothetical protein